MTTEERFQQFDRSRPRQTFFTGLLALTLALVGGVFLAGVAIPRDDPGLTRERAITEIEKLGGSVDIDDANPEMPAVAVDFGDTQVTDAGLVHLKALSELQTLRLAHTRVSDAGLLHLEGLTQLKTLDLFRTKITDAGLAHLKGLPNLQTLTLSFTKITDAGLEHLKGLTKLQMPWLTDTRVTEAGIDQLKESLPKFRTTD